MHLLAAPQAFKGTLSATHAATAMKKGILAASPEYQVSIQPLADGGDGTLEILIQLEEGERIFFETIDALGRPSQGSWGYFPKTNEAVIEQATLCGWSTLTSKERNPLKTTTYAMGEAISSALAMGVSHLIICLGGSATNDAGVGLLQALGVRCYSKNNQLLELGGYALQNLQRVDLSSLSFSNLTVTVLCDVNNPLLGEKGATRTFAPQKGANREEVEQLEEALTHYADVVHQLLNKSIGHEPYGGAGGGVAATLKAFFQAELISGSQWMLERTGLLKRLNSFDLIISGEGRLDHQTTYGKGLFVLASQAKKREIPLLAIVGSLDPALQKSFQEMGLTAAIPLSFYPVDIHNLTKVDWFQAVEQATEAAVRFFRNTNRI